MKKIFLWSLLSVVFVFQSVVVFAAIISEPIDYNENGEALQGFLYYDDAAQKVRPGVIVIHEWKGLGDYAKKRAEMLAGLGYTAFAADMYGKGVLAKDHEEAGKLAGVYFLNRSRMQARARAAYDAFIKTGKVDAAQIAAIGYCFGGTTVLEMARNGLPLKGVASFHGILATPSPAKKGKVTARVLVFNGTADKMVLPADVKKFEDEMQIAGVDYQVHNFKNAAHSFTVWDANMPEKGIQYNKKADMKSWKLLKKFLTEIFKIKTNKSEFKTTT